MLLLHFSPFYSDMVYTRDHNDEVFDWSSENRETVCNGVKMTEFALTLEALVSYKNYRKGL